MTKHGWVRTRPWRLRSVEATAQAGVRALLSLEHDDLAFLYEVEIGEELSLSLSVRNTGGDPQTVEAALHHYLAVGDVTAVEVAGLEGQTYWDALHGGVHEQEGTLRLTGPTDRVYSASRPVVVSDPAAGRRLVVSGVNAPDAVVWNPWSQGSRGAADLAEDEWPTFVCAESALVRDHAVVLEPGQSVSMGSRIRVEPL